MEVRELIGGPVITCSPKTTIREAAGLMVSNDAGSVAVLTDGNLVGIVTERDMISAMAASIDPHRPVEEVMTPDPDSLEPDVSITEVADWMMAAGYRHLPVVEGRRLIGMISIKDVLWGVTDGRPA
jgi:CBS domain-containing protein